MASETGIPKLDAPLVQPNERAPGAARIIAIPWYMLLVELWRRTGSGSGIAPTMVQTGVVQEFAGVAAAVPTGYLLCDGAAYLAVDYPDLFAVIGYTYGGAAGTFNVPNRQDRFAIGAGGVIAPNLGDTGGAATATIAKANLPSYALTVNDPGHNHTQNSHNHTQNSHNHTQDAHTHTQNSHNHTQDAHTHTQNSHNHTQNSHNHTQDAHDHHVASDSVGASTVGANEYLSRSWTGLGDNSYTLGGNTTPAPGRGLSESITAVNNATTATNQATTATNQNTTATNNATTATNQNTVATNQAATATNQATTATNNANTTGITVDSGGSDTALPILPPYIGMNFIIKT